MRTRSIFATIIFLFGVLLLSACTHIPQEQKEEGAMMENNTVAIAKKRAMPQKQVTTSYTGTLLAGKTSPFLDFTKADYDKTLTSGKLVVLYFYATWCPICGAETRDALYPAFNELTTDKVIGFRVNYNDSDTDEAEKALARQFGVAYQHTKVFVKNGTRVLKAPDSWTKDRYVQEINKALGL